MEPKKLYFVCDVKLVNKQLKHQEELNVLESIKDRLLHILLFDGTAEALNCCDQIIKEEMGDKPIKGNIFYSVIPADNGTDIEFVRHSHGGGNHSAKRITGGVVVAIIEIASVRGELSPIHGLTFYRPEERDPFAHLFQNPSL